MDCPICSGKARVYDTKPTPGCTRRKLRCLDHGHEFSTEEGRVGWRLNSDVVLRQSGDKQLQLNTFQPERLRKQVGRAVLGRLSEAEIADVVDGAISRLRFQIVPEEAEPLAGQEYEVVAKATGKKEPLAWLMDTKVRDAVEYELHAKERRLAHVLYALSFRGRTDFREGWTRAEDVLDWLYGDDAYPDTVQAIPPRPETTAYEWRPTKPAAYPEFVVKRPTPPVLRPGREGPGPGRDRATVGYLDSRFRQSIRNAMLGRHDADHMSTYVSWWVLHDLEGQKRVHSSQLAIGVLDCLRRVDEIAYLRWVTQLKDFRSIREFRDEATALITNPSPPLTFSPTGALHKPVAVVPH